MPWMRFSTGLPLMCRLRASRAGATRRAKSRKRNVLCAAPFRSKFVALLAGAVLLAAELVAGSAALAQASGVDSAFAAVRRGRFEAASLKLTAADIPAVARFLGDDNEDVR